jgi:hypothetical protein
MKRKRMKKLSPNIRRRQVAGSEICEVDDGVAAQVLLSLSSLFRAVILQEISIDRRKSRFILLIHICNFKVKNNKYHL